MRSRLRWPGIETSVAALTLSTLLGIATNVAAQDIHYFSERPRDLEISADAETLLVFPAAPFARVCQPIDIAEFYPLTSAEELQTMMLPSGASYKTLSSAKGSDGSEAPSAGGSDLLARHLKIVPRRTSGTATCAIRLVNEQVINVRLMLTKMIAKPIVEFRSGLEKARGGAAITASLGSLNVFRSLMQGGELSFLDDETPTEGAARDGTGGTRQRITRTTETASYRLVYLGTDKEHFRAWKLEGEALKPFKAVPMRDARIGDFHYSAFRPTKIAGSANVPANYQFAVGEKFQLFILSRSDIAVDEVLGRLP